jgi:chorismate mutase
VETSRAVLTTTPQGKAADAQFVKWLMDHQREAGVLSTVSDLVESESDNPAARMTAQEIMQRVLAAQQRRAAPAPAAAVA